MHKMLAAIWIFLILSSTPAAALEQVHFQAINPVNPSAPGQLPPQAGQQVQPFPQQLPPTVQNIPQRVQIACRLSSLDNVPGNEEAATQVQKLHDELYVNPRAPDANKHSFLGGDVHAGTPKVPLEDRETLQNRTILVPLKTDKDKDSKQEALSAELPDKKFSVNELAFAGHSITGPFSIGPVLDDTVRIGRCTGENRKEYPCYTTAGNETPAGQFSGKQNKRNEAAGITQNFSLVGQELKEWLPFTGDDHSVPAYFTEEAKQAIVNQAVKEEANELETISLTHAEKALPNVLEAQQFTASMGTTCSKETCTLSTYSAFDKYFNAWFSAEMVISNFGPTLLGQTRRLLGYGARRGWPFDFTQNKFFQAWRRNFTASDTLYGQIRLKRIDQRWNKSGLTEIRNKLIENTDWDGGYTFMKSGSFRKWRDELLKKDGILDNITDPQARGDLFKNMRDLRGWALSRKAVFQHHKEAYDRAVLQYGLGSAQEVGARIDYARNVSQMMIDFDNDLKLDFPEWWMRDETAGIYNKAYFHNGTQKFVTVANDSLHTQVVLGEFAQNGNWSRFHGLGDAYAVSPQGNLYLYELRPDGRLVASVGVQDIEKNFARFKDKAVRLEDTGETLLLDETNLAYIKANSTGNVKVLEANWDRDHPIEITPLDWTNKILHKRTKENLIDKPLRNATILYGDLVEKNFAGLSRRYTSALDKSFAQEEDILKTYFSLRGGAKLTATPFMYWYAKRGFVNQENVSAYQLPDTWREISVDGERPEAVYSNAYIDFFANGGSDTGDLFVEVLNKLPWKMVLNELAENYGPFQSYDELTKGESFRSEVENVAFLTRSHENCVNCGVTLHNTNIQGIEQAQGNLRVNFTPYAPQLDAYLVEDVQSKEAEAKGQTLIAFAHATDIDGETADLEQTGATKKEKIDVVRAVRDDKTCEAAVKNLGLGFVGTPSRVGAVLAAGESLGYVMFGWSAIIGTAIQQIIITPKLQDCVDHIEGYYIHFYDPGYNTVKEKLQPQAQATKKITEVIKSFSDTEKKPDDETENKNFAEQLKSVIADTTQQLAQKADAQAVVQGIVSLKGNASGNLSAEKLFFFWFKGQAASIGYADKGLFVTEDPETGAKITQDNKAGKLLFTRPDGTVVETLSPIDPALQTQSPDEQATPEDHVRLTKTDGRIPGRKIPQRITGIGLTNTDEIIMFMNPQANVKVVHPEILNCIQQGVLQQTGVRLQSPDLIDVFGEAIAVETTTHGQIRPNPATNTLTADGPQRLVVSHPNAQAQIRMNANVDVVAGGEATPAGRLSGISFRNGQITYKADTHELLMWLEHNQLAVIPGRYVEGLRAIPASVTNPETGCPEPALNLEATPIAGSDNARNAVDNFNASMKKQGPFQVLDTDNKQIIFYSELKNGQCIPKVRVVDKKTGQVLLDQPLDGPITQTPDGVQFRTADGKDHTLTFKVENGVPQVSLDNGLPETLRRAQGPNGGFWYDPETGLWYPENSQFIPLLEAFKQQGFLNGVNPDGSVTGRPGGSPLNINIGGGQQNPFNLPSLPENPVLVLLFLFALLGVMAVAQVRMGTQKEN